MKKTLAVAAVLAAFAGSAAADVTVYGKVDLGMLYTHQGDFDRVEMASGAGGNSSRLGFKGTEKIGDDLTVGFVYETGLTADTSKGDKFLSRDSHVFVKGSFGEIGLGYYGVLDASTGPYSISGNISAAGTGWGGDIMDQGWVVKTNARMSNAVTYVTPEFAGLTVYAQVASGSYDLDGAGTGTAVAEYTHEADMYMGLGASYKAGAFGAVLTVSSTEYGQTQAADTLAKAGLEDLNVVAGVNYNFGAFTAYLGGNYYETGVKGEDQYGVVASVKGALAGGTAYASAGYGEVSKDAGDETRMYFGVGYQYPLSKATFLYGAANWKQTDKTKVLGDEGYGAEVNTTEVAFGIVHNF